MPPDSASKCSDNKTRKLTVREQAQLMIKTISRLLYHQITPQECIRYAKIQTDKEVEYLNTFCSTHDKIAAWVTTTILDCKVLERRSDLQYKVAEKCRNLNFASMSAIINALSSTVVTHLHLHWAHVGRKNTVDALLKHNDPSGGFAGYRNLQLSAEGPYVPFVGTYLSDIVHIKDHLSHSGEGGMKWRKSHQGYSQNTIPLRRSRRRFSSSEERLQDSPKIGRLPCQVVQHSEIANTDIRRGLEAAEF
ncbi:hypothetical protein VNI00_011191 [Paramarasmius palmivorus]|uniref:Ras-GEF domain-containing protein n=1 Tax=Paramarasmius palmivorus TaxID=297713 RepID=A0AAW0CD58_9AGAR